jgi:hypothetical protein
MDRLVAWTDTLTVADRCAAVRTGQRLFARPMRLFARPIRSAPIGSTAADVLAARVHRGEHDRGQANSLRRHASAGKNHNGGKARYLVVG